jgi:pSer/pThr/pTyr-binding forkhead associated (FHA) protein
MEINNMPKIVVKRKAEIYQEYPIRPFQNKIRIGTEGDNDLVIEDKKVSMHHLTIEKEGTKYYVSDNDSAFGSHVNGQRIENKTLLRSGDEIKIGEHTLQFENVLFEANDNGNGNETNFYYNDEENYSNLESAIPVEEVEVLENNDGEAISIQEPIHEPKFEQQFSTYGQKPLYLLAIYGPYLGKKFQLNFGTTKIGRDDTLNDIVIRKNKHGEVDPSVSRRHATIFFENGEYYITDKRSKTRTYVNQEILEEDNAIKLNVLDEIEIVSDQRSTIFRVVSDDELDIAPPKKSGEWWIRKSRLTTLIVSIVGIIGLGINLFLSSKNLMDANQNPSQFSAAEQVLFAEKNPIEGFNQPEEIKRLMYSLTPALGDLNGDGILDIVFVDHAGYLRILNGATYKSLWTETYNYRIQFPYNLVLADLNGNGLPDIVLPTVNSRLTAIDGQYGTEIWTSPLLGSELSGTPVVADINGDHIADVCFCLKQGGINIGYGKYDTPEWTSQQTNSEILSSPSAGDFNGDRIAEVAIGTENGEVFIFSGLTNNFSKIINVNEELQKAKGSLFEDHQIRNHVSVGDVDGDMCDDLAIITQNGNLLVISGKSYRRLWYDELPADEVFSSNFVSPIGIGDLNNDKKADIVIFTSDKKIVAYRGNGQANGKKEILWGYMPEINEDFFAHPVIADVNKDGNSDVIAAGLFGGIYIFSGNNGKIIWQHDTISPLEKTIISTPLVADLKGDRYLDILIRRADNSFNNIKTSIRVPKSTLWWSQVTGNENNSGNYKSASLSGTKDIISIVLSLTVIIGMTLAIILPSIRRKKYFAF